MTDHSRQPIGVRVLLHLKEIGPTNVVELGEKLNVPQDVVYNALSKLQSDGVVRASSTTSRSFRWYYTGHGAIESGWGWRGETAKRLRHQPMATGREKG